MAITSMPSDVLSVAARCDRARGSMLGEAEERLRAIFASAVEGIITVDEGGLIDSANPATERMFGYPADELIGKCADMLMPSPDGKDGNVIRYLRQGESTMAGVGREVLGRHKSGHSFPLWLEASEMQPGGRRMFAGFLHDISAHKEAQAALERQASQQNAVATFGLRALASRDIGALLDEAARIVAEMLQVRFTRIQRLLPGRGLLFEAGVGWSHEWHGAAIEPEGYGSQAGLAVLTREPVMVENYAVEARFPISPMLEEHGVVSGVSVSIQVGASSYGTLCAHSRRRREFTSEEIDFLQSIANTLAIAIERLHSDDAVRESEERFRSLIEAMPAAVYTCDADGYVTLCNDAAVRLWGRRPAVGEDRWCGSWKLFYPDGSPMATDRCPMAAVLKGIVPAADFELTAERPDGSRVTVLAHPKLFRDASGQVTGALNVLVDISDRKQREAEIRRHAAELEATNDELSRFNRAAVGRELRMIELKQEINELRSMAGLQPRYATHHPRLEPP